jgi:hypothetical protein
MNYTNQKTLTEGIPTLFLRTEGGKLVVDRGGTDKALMPNLRGHVRILLFRSDCGECRNHLCTWLTELTRITELTGDESLAVDLSGKYNSSHSIECPGAAIAILSWHNSAVESPAFLVLQDGVIIRQFHGASTIGAAIRGRQ